MVSGPARGRTRRATTVRALLPCLAFIGPRRNPWPGPDADAGHAAPGARRPRRAAGFCRCARRRAALAESRADPAADPRLRNPDTPAPSRVGKIPTYGLPAANGASESGYNSLNRKRKKPKYYPGQAKPKPPPGPGTPAPQPLVDAESERPRAPVGAAVGVRQQDADPAGDGRHGGRPARAQAAQGSTTIRSARSAITPAVF